MTDEEAIEMGRLHRKIYDLREELKSEASAYKIEMEERLHWSFTQRVEESKRRQAAEKHVSELSVQNENLRAERNSIKAELQDVKEERDHYKHISSNASELHWFSNHCDLEREKLIVDKKLAEVTAQRDNQKYLIDYYVEQVKKLSEKLSKSRADVKRLTEELNDANNVIIAKDLALKVNGVHYNNALENLRRNNTVIDFLRASNASMSKKIDKMKEVMYDGVI